MAGLSPHLKALPPEERAALGGAYLKIPHSPFRVGRESRIFNRPGGLSESRRKLDSIPNNELYLIEPGTVFSASRVHFLIDYRDGMHVIVDRGSSCGTLVEKEPRESERRAAGE